MSTRDARAALLRSRAGQSGGHDENTTDDNWGINGTNSNGLLGAISDQEFSVGASLLSATFIDCVGLLPRAPAYGPGEIKIHLFNNEVGGKSFKALLAAGTLVLDAILYIALHQNTAYGKLFDCSGPTTRETSGAIDHRNLSMHVLLAAIEHFYTRGSLPSYNENKLSKNIIQRTLGVWEIGTEGRLAELLSTGALDKFPSEVFLDIDIATLPQITLNRIKLSPAGTKFRRYAEMIDAIPASEKQDYPAGQAIIDSVKNMNLADLLHFHPLHIASVIKPSQCSLKIQAEMLRTLTPDGIHQLLSVIQSKRMLALMKDSRMYNDELAKKYCPILDDPAYGKGCITLTQINDIIHYEGEVVVDE